MSTFRAYNRDTKEIVEYDAVQPQAEHLTEPWQVFAVHPLPPTPDQPPAEPGPVRITRFALRDRFTRAEKVAVEIAALDDPSATFEQRAQAAALRASQEDILAAQFVDLNKPETRAGVEALEAAGLIGAGRATEILDTPPGDDEVWSG